MKQKRYFLEMEAPVQEHEAKSWIEPASLMKAWKTLTFAVLSFGSIMGGIAWVHHQGIGAFLFAFAAALVLILWMARRVIERRAVPAALFGSAVLVFQQACFVFAGWAVVAPTLPWGAFWSLVAASLLALGLGLRRDLRTYDRAWERMRRHNERSLDLDAGTFDRGRGFQVDPPRATGFDRFASRFILPLVPAITTFGIVLNGHGLGDVRALALGVLGPTAGVMFSGPLVAQALVHLRRLRGYERQIGRPIFTR